MKFAIISSRFSEKAGNALIILNQTCEQKLQELGVEFEHFEVPGAFEIPQTTSRLAKSGKYDAVICLGSLIRGATPHFDYIASEATKGIAQIALETNVPVVFGVITADTLEQAIERAGSKAGNKGSEAAISAIEMTNLFEQF